MSQAKHPLRVRSAPRMESPPICRQCRSTSFMARCFVHDGWRCDRCDICFVGGPPESND